MDNPLLIAPGFFAILLLVLGLVIGSFLNLVIARVPHEQSVIHPRSRCPKCGHMLPWYENIPVLSYLFLLGRCSGCKTPISIRYPLVELLTGMLFLACLRRFGWTYELAPALMLVSLLVPLTFIDLEHWLLPHSLTLPGIALGILTAAPMGLDRLRDAAIGAGVGFVWFWAMEWIGAVIFKKEALGGGDKYLLAMLGGFLSYQSLLAVVFLSSLQGAVVGLLLLAIRGRAGPAPKEERAGAAPDQTAAPGETAAPEPSSHAGMTAALDSAGAAPSLPEVSPSVGAGGPGEGGGSPSGEVAAPPSPGASTAPGGGMPEAGQGLTEEEEEDDWVPGPTNIPFGPWLALAALEILLVGDWLASLLPRHLEWLLNST